MFDPNKPAETKGGYKARFLGRINNDAHPLVFSIDNGTNEAVETYTEDGFYNYDKYKHAYDLKNIPEKHVYYLNVYGDLSCTLFELKEEADKRNYNRIACIRIEFEDGQFDE